MLPDAEKDRTAAVKGYYIHRTPQHDRSVVSHTVDVEEKNLENHSP